MSCAACASRVEKAVSGVPGVTSCSVSLLTNSMGVEGTAGAAEIISADSQAVYRFLNIGTAKPSEKEQSSAKTEFLTRNDLDKTGFFFYIIQ